MCCVSLIVTLRECGTCAWYVQIHVCGARPNVPSLCAKTCRVARCTHTHCSVDHEIKGIIYMHVHVREGVEITCSLCSCHSYIVHDNQARQRHTLRTAFSFFKEKTALGGIRTHDTPRSRRALFQLSYIPGQLSWQSSNPGIQGKATNLANTNCTCVWEHLLHHNSVHVYTHELACAQLVCLLLV